MLPRPSKLFSLVALIAGFSIPVTLPAAYLVTLVSPASPSAGQAGVTIINVTGSGFPGGTLNVTVTLKPATPGGGPTATVTASHVSTLVGSTRRVTVQIPSSVAVAVPTPYLVSVSGSSSSGATFSSKNAAALTVNPPAVIFAVNPNTAQTGATPQTVSVTITGQYTNFVQGATQASFGPGTSVGGSPEGVFGPVTVTSPTILTALVTIDPLATLGARNVAVQTGVQQESLPNGFTITAGNPAIPVVTITSPGALSLFNSSPITVNGTVDTSTDTVMVNGVAATVSGTNFTASGVPLKEGPNLITATATNLSGAQGTSSITVTLDTTPPHISIDTPPDGSMTSSSTITVSGMISDVVLGTVNAQQATVTVNGISAAVSNRNYLAGTVPLSPGANTITAVGTDRAGNTASVSITVIQVPAPAQPMISMVSGNAQTAPIGSLVASPLVVALKDASGHPVASQPIVFRVTENNGTLAGISNVISTAASGRSIVVNSDSSGQAQVNWTLGMRAGAGNNVVTATSANFLGSVSFTAVAQQGTPGMISLDAGNNQTGVVGLPLPRPFVIAVTDAGHNRLPNIPVTFTVKQGGGSFSGQTSLTMKTDSDGHATAILTLGVQEGIENNLVEANFPGNTGFPVSFTASGMAAGDPAKTEISGVVLDNTNIPIQGVTLTVENTTLTTQSDAQGQFVIANAPVGTVKLVADGTTAARPGTWPVMAYEMVTIPGQNNTIGMPIYLLPLDLAEGIQVDATHGGTLTLAAVPGFSLTVAPGSATFPDGSNSGIVSVTLVHADKVPMTPNFGQQPRFIVSIQPVGTHFNPPAPMTIPNVDGLKPGEVTELYSFDHDLGSFVAIGTGTVSEDGTVIKSDPGVGIIKGGWHCGGNPTTNGTAQNCGTCQTCTGNACVPNTSGTNCGPCWGPGGTCTGAGSCAGATPLPYGTTCGSCFNGGYCDGKGNCIGGSSAGNGSSCGQNPCVVGQTCQNGLCTGGTNASVGTACQVGFNPCVIGACDGNGNCVNGVPVPALPPVSCGNACIGGGTCDGSGNCAGGTPVTCPSTGNPCNAQVCDPSNGGCTLIPSGGLSCDVCSTGATCDTGGNCSNGSPLSNVPCGPCFTPGGACVNGACQGATPLQNGSSCGACFSGGTCQSGACLGGTQSPDGTNCETNGHCVNGVCSHVQALILLLRGGTSDSGSSDWGDLIDLIHSTFEDRVVATQISPNVSRTAQESAASSWITQQQAQYGAITVVLIGHSLGGDTAVRATTIRSDLVVAIDPINHDLVPPSLPPWKFDQSGLSYRSSATNVVDYHQHNASSCLGLEGYQVTNGQNVDESSIFGVTTNHCGIEHNDFIKSLVISDIRPLIK